jgi:hypothetical protein
VAQTSWTIVRTQNTFCPIFMANLYEEYFAVSAATHYFRSTGSPLTRSALRSTITSTRLAILMKGIPLVIP